MASPWCPSHSEAPARHLGRLGEPKKVDPTVARTTIAKTLKDNRIAPSPDRPTSWSTFLKSHAGIIAAADFFTVEGWTKRGLVRHYHAKCPHQGMDNKLIAQTNAEPQNGGREVVDARLVGLLRSYRRSA